MSDEYCVGIVDDEEMLVRTYRMLFERQHIPLSFIALDSTEAIEKFKAASPRPKVMIIDYRLPRASGIEVMHEILRMEPDTKTIFISADGDIGEESLKAGATIFFKKPVRTKEIIAAVRSLLIK